MTSRPTPETAASLKNLAKKRRQVFLDDGGSRNPEIISNYYKW
jgi:hypothetical protein